MSIKTEGYDPKQLRDLIINTLDDNKAEDIIEIDLPKDTAIADFMLIASGRSSRQVAAIAENLMRTLKNEGYKSISIEGLNQGDWVLIDTGDAIIHVFRPEVREFYNLERIWSPDMLNSITSSRPNNVSAHI